MNTRNFNVKIEGSKVQFKEVLAVGFMVNLK